MVNHCTDYPAFGKKVPVTESNSWLFPGFPDFAVNQTACLFYQNLVVRRSYPDDRQYNDVFFFVAVL